MDKEVTDLMEVLKVPGISTKESEIVAILEKFLRLQGVLAGAIHYDRVQDQSDYGEQIGNMIVRDAVFRQRIVDLYRVTFQQAAAGTKNAAGEAAHTEWKLGPCYKSYAIPRDALVERTTVSVMSNRAYSRTSWSSTAAWTSIGSTHAACPWSRWGVANTAPIQSSG